MKKLLLVDQNKQFIKAGVCRASAWFLFLLAVFHFSSISATQADSSEIKERLNRIFYWQIADELKLSQKAEKDLSRIVEDIQKRRNEALDERQKCLDELKSIEKKITSSSAELILKRYQSALTKLAKVDTEEHERLKALLGPEALAKFYLVREAVAQKIREALRHTESSKASENEPKK